MPTIRLASYNVHRAVGRDRRMDPGPHPGVLREINADVYALQEVEAHDTGGDMLAWLAKEMGADAIAGTTLLRHDGHYGNGLLARCHCIVRTELVDLSWREREPRGAISADLDFGGGHVLKVVATHLGLRPAERREQVERLLQLFTWHEQERAVLMGDVNEWFLWGRPLKKLHEYFDQTPAVPTFPSGGPVFALDRLWTHPGSILKDLKAHVSPLSRVASDHLPLVASIEL
jgi:endonuclease/exonuclease/phosphatase family metal-dependent hydrolase